MLTTFNPQKPINSTYHVTQSFEGFEREIRLPLQLYRPSAYTERLEQISAYLHRRLEEGYITSEVISRAWKALLMLLAFNKRLSVPVAGVGGDQQILFEWDRREHHLELEVFASGDAQLFYLNRSTNRTQERDYPIDGSAMVCLNVEMADAFGYFIIGNER